LVCGIDLNVCAVVNTPSVTLAVDQRNRDSRNIRHLVRELSKLNRDGYLVNREVHRRWAWYDSVDKGPGFKGKRTQVKPRVRLSLQRHKHKSEYCEVVKRIAELINCGRPLLLRKNEPIYIPMDRIHRRKNTKNYPLELIQVQSGAKLSEDYIERIKDIYEKVDLERSA